MNIGSIAKVIGYALIIIPGAAKFNDPELVNQAAVVVSGLIGFFTLAWGEVKKDKQTKAIIADVKQTKSDLQDATPIQPFKRI